MSACVKTDAAVRVIVGQHESVTHLSSGSRSDTCVVASSGFSTRAHIGGSSAARSRISCSYTSDVSNENDVKHSCQPHGGNLVRRKQNAR